MGLCRQLLITEISYFIPPDVAVHLATEPSSGGSKRLIITTIMIIVIIVIIIIIIIIAVSSKARHLIDKGEYKTHT